MSRLRVSAIVLVYGEEPWLERCVKTLLASEDVDVEVVLVDNGCTDGSVERLEAEGVDGLTVVHPGSNLGFAAGNNEGVRHAGGDVIALVNGDAIAEPTALARLAEVATAPGVGIATASVRLADEPDLLNSGGNDIHFLGMSWAGRFRQPAAEFPEACDVTSASGAGMAMRRSLWDDLGGFDDAYFIYHEDAEMSLRCWQRGLRVVYVPEAVIAHHYEFSKNPRKFYLLERNRLVTVLSLYGGRMLVLLAPALLAFELAMLVLATKEGWARQKVAGWGWLLRRLGWLRARRAELQRTRTVPDRELAHLFVDHLDPGNYAVPSALRPFDQLFALYWRLVRRFV